MTFVGSTCLRGGAGIVLVTFLTLVGGPTLGPAWAAPAASRVSQAPLTPQPSQPLPGRPLPQMRPKTPPTSQRPITFYVVKGGPDACGRGCDRWIAAEGTIDAGAAPRFRKFLQKVPDRRLPIYFASPGGNLDQAVVMGAMLRERAAVARVGRTMAEECGFEAQDSDVCLKVKASGRELHGDLSTRGAVCASACPYVMLGAATREIAPDAVLGVHSPKVVTHFRVEAPTAEMRAAATRRGLDRAEQLLTSYITKMGVDLALLRLADTVRYEDMHMLTRDEIVRFGIDRREHVETPWLFEFGMRSMVQKVVAERNDTDKSFRLIAWRLTCFDLDRFALEFRRPAASAASPASVRVALGSANSLALISIPVKLQGFEFWGTQFRKATLLSLSDAPHFDFTEAAQGPDGAGPSRTSRLSNEGLTVALDRLLATCAPAKVNTAGARSDIVDPAK
ncbi:hypothetical protein [Bradyrhizobium sp. CCGUVB23]|uniref:COG3904 family protein n=1 Tax=Bradyrhizobium sp. CCGUVB23 TaxID=2949630 RepID=UPI0020B32F87|nr:hypothetical protein [Bradyrhizobium sp. CCGUVB23]MCP3465431.1 hypothetical protein [Bradyrhizobium sp. CCGUVB23]